MIRRPVVPLVCALCGAIVALADAQHSAADSPEFRRMLDGLARRHEADCRVKQN